VVADLEIVNGKASMMYARDAGVPWHKEGTSVETAVNSKQAIKLAGLDWKVETQPITLVGSASRKPIESHVATMRMSDHKVLGIVGKDYKPIQNIDSFDFLDGLVADRELLYDTAGALNGGRTTWVLARFPEDHRILDDVYARYLLAATSHDSSRSFQVWATETRVVCANTLAIATNARAAVSIRHSGDVKQKLEAARALLRLTNQEHERMRQWLEKLSKEQVNEEQVQAVTENIFGSLDEDSPTRRKNAVAAFLQIYREETQRVGETAYALANAVTGYSNHALAIKANTESTRLSSLIGGRGAEINNTGLAAVAKVANVRL
jgi:phage/plasmid-like protein (TIGR03299 family)